MADHELPVVARRGEEGEIVRILIHEEWFDKLTPIFRHFKEISSIISVESIPTDLTEALEKPFELINSLCVEFGISGWMFSLSLIYVLHWAAAKGVSLGKFIYEQANTGFTLGGPHGATYGGEHGGTYGNLDITVVKEIGG